MSKGLNPCYFEMVESKLFELTVFFFPPKILKMPHDEFSN